MAIETLRKNDMMAQDACNVYKGLTFPDGVYDHITDYHDKKARP
jgi:hypothetical protein